MAKSATRRHHIEPDIMQIAFRDSNGYPIGQETDPDNVASNTTTHAYRVDGMIDFAFATTTRPLVTNRASRTLHSQVQATATAYGNPTVNTSHVDEQLEAYRAKTTVDTTTNTAAAISVSNAPQKVFPQFMVMLSQSIFNENTGQSEFLHRAVLNTQIQNTVEAGAVAVTGDVTNPNPTTYVLSTSLAMRDISGYLLSGLSLGITEDIKTEWRTDNPLGLTTFVGDGIATTTTLGYRPISTDATGAAENNITKNGALLAVTSVNTTTGLVTFSAAPGDGDIVVILYQTNFVAI